jgi:predicted SAM-dependent methyltransferase
MKKSPFYKFLVNTYLNSKTFLLERKHLTKTLLKAYSFLLENKKAKFNVGASTVDIGNDWFPTDIDVLNITINADWRRFLWFTKLDNISAEHVWEHLTDADTILANANCFKFLKKNGIMRLAVPDGFHPDKEYIDYVRPGGHGAGADDHKILYTYKTMKERLENVGFQVNLLEYWDEKGEFHFTEWSDEEGRISRSKRYDERNQGGELKYTSLIVDAVKL